MRRRLERSLKGQSEWKSTVSSSSSSSSSSGGGGGGGGFKFKWSSLSSLGVTEKRPKEDDEHRAAKLFFVCPN